MARPSLPRNNMDTMELITQHFQDIYSCHTYGIRLSHIFEIPSISNEKPSISMEIPSILIKNLGFRSKY